MIPDDQMAIMRAEATKALDITATVQRATAAKDGHGGQGYTWNTIGTVACDMATPTGGMLLVIAGRESDMNMWQVTVPYGSDIKEKDRLIIGSDTLTVENVYLPESYQIVMRLLCVEVL